MLRQVAWEVIPGLRGPTRVSEAEAKSIPPLEDLAAVDEAVVVRAFAAIREGLPRRLLDFLIDHPDERFDGVALMQRLELQRHDEVARGFAALGADLAAHGIARPWNEAQNGYLLPKEQAALLGRARERS